MTGKITFVGSVVTGEGKNGTWNKFQAVITEQEGKYPQSMAFDVFNDKVAVALDEVCTIHVEFKANASKEGDKYFTNINAWKKEGGVAQPAATSAPAATAAQPATGGTLSKKAVTPEQFEKLKSSLDGLDDAARAEKAAKYATVYDLTPAQVVEQESDLPF